MGNFHSLADYYLKGSVLNPFQAIPIKPLNGFIGNHMEKARYKFLIIIKTKYMYI